MRWACASARSASRPCSFAFRSEPGEPGVVASRGYFPATLGAAVRQKARWLGGIAFSGWDRLGWSGGLGERWMRLRDRRGPLAALLIVAAYVAALLWSQLWLAKLLGAPVEVRIDQPLGHPAHHQCVAARLARADARRLHRFRLRARGGPAVHAATVRRQSDRGARRLPRLLAPSAAAGRRAGTRLSTSSRRRPCYERAQCVSCSSPLPAGPCSAERPPGCCPASRLHHRQG